MRRALDPWLGDGQRRQEEMRGAIRGKTSGLCLLPQRRDGPVFPRAGEEDSRDKRSARLEASEAREHGVWRAEKKRRGT